MQYGADLITYKRIHKERKEEKKSQINMALIGKLLACFASSFLISRVLLVNSMAPFGIGFIISIILLDDQKLDLFAGSGAFIGYMTAQGRVKDAAAYMLVAATVTVVGYMRGIAAKRKKLIVIFTASFIEFVIFKYFMDGMTMPNSIFLSVFETAIIYPIYYIIQYSITCFNNINTHHLFTSEEIISMSVTMALMIAGTQNFTIFSMSVCNILALLAIMIISYVKGSSVGAASGAAAGTITGMTADHMGIYISVFSLCGLVTGTFKSVGKWASGMTCLIAFCIIKMYAGIGSQFKVIEALISLAIFLCIRESVYNKLAVELSWDKKRDYFNECYGERIKGMFLDRLNSFTDVLYNMSQILNGLADNDKLVMKKKSSALVENLADRVCMNCSLNAMCWKRETYKTYSSFEELIRNYQENKLIIPQELNDKCVRRTILLKKTEEIVNNYMISEMWRIRLSEGRELLAGQIGNMANSVEEIAEEFSTDIKFNTQAENIIIRILDKKKIKYRNVMCFNDKNDRLIIKLNMEACMGEQKCIREILPMLNESLDKCMCISEEGCNIEPEESSCSIIFEETPKYHVASHIARTAKDGEEYNGDSYSFGKLNDGTYMTIISDGMGSGPEAGQESTAAVELVEKLAKAGFSKITAINTVNSIMSLKFFNDEKFSTLDLCSIDLYSGEVNFMKVGAAASFIKRKNKVDVISSRSLPIGVLDKVDVDITSKNVRNGDIIVVISDGVLDYNDDVVGRTDWLTDYLEKTTIVSPGELAEDILKHAKELSNNKIKDDMTIIVNKIYKVY